MKPRLIFCAFVNGLLAGCLNFTPPASPIESHGLSLSARSSNSVQVSQPRFQMNHGVLELAGSVSRKPSAGTTAFSHLDILFYDVGGNLLQTRPIRFAPRSVGHSRFSSQSGYYSLRLDVFPEGTTEVAVRAHDAEMASSHAGVGGNP